MWRVFCVVLFVLACSAGTDLPSLAAAESLEEAEFAYDRGEYTQAARLFGPLAEQGVASAQFYLGLMHEKGRGVRQDYPTALMWFRKAAAQGYVGPQSNLALMYERGRGVRKDLVRAFMWYQLAGTMLPGSDGTAALKRRDQLSSQMTAAQIEQAQELVKRCQQSQFKQCD
jgi:TPR repeat protein